jgi:Phosphodiester glycosidase
MSQPEQPEPSEPHRSGRRRRRHRSKSKSGFPTTGQIGLALGVLGILVLGSLVVWVWLGGLRGPRFLENWTANGPLFEPWQTLEPGIEYSRAQRTSPRPLRIHALRVNLGDPNLEVVVPRGEYAGGGETRALWPLSWLKRHDLRAVINATPFAPAPIFPSRPTRLQGLAISNGQLWSEPAGNLDNLIVAPDGTVQFLQGRMPIGDARSAVGGFLIIRRDGVNTGDTSVQDAASVVGISADRQWMYWLVVDGGQPGYSEGVTPREASDLIAELGASDAIRLDGGASSALAVAAGGNRVLNRSRNPVYNGAPRPVGNVLGIRRKAAP